MGKLFDEKGFMIIPDKREKKDTNTKCLVVTEAYCHNGHDMMWNHAKFNKMPGIHIKVEDSSGHEGDLVLSPFYGDTTSVSLGIDLKSGDKVKLKCPICGEELPTLQPCGICEVGELKAIHLTKDLDYNNSIAICNVVDCHNSVFLNAGELITEEMYKSYPGDDS